MFLIIIQSNRAWLRYGSSNVGFGRPKTRYCTLCCPISVAALNHPCRLYSSHQCLLLCRQFVRQFVRRPDHRVDQSRFRIRMTGTAHEFTIDVLASDLAQGLGEPPCGLWLAHVVASAVTNGDLHVRHFWDVVEQLPTAQEASIDHVMNL